MHHGGEHLRKGAMPGTTYGRSGYYKIGQKVFKLEAISQPNGETIYNQTSQPISEERHLAEMALRQATAQLKDTEQRRNFVRQKLDQAQRRAAADDSGDACDACIRAAAAGLAAGASAIESANNADKVAGRHGRRGQYSPKKPPPPIPAGQEASAAVPEHMTEMPGTMKGQSGWYQIGQSVFKMEVVTVERDGKKYRVFRADKTHDGPNPMPARQWREQRQQQQAQTHQATQRELVQRQVKRELAHAQQVANVVERTHSEVEEEYQRTKKWVAQVLELEEKRAKEEQEAQHNWDQESMPSQQNSSVTGGMPQKEDSLRLGQHAGEEETVQFATKRSERQQPPSKIPQLRPPIRADNAGGRRVPPPPIRSATQGGEAARRAPPSPVRQRQPSNEAKVSPNGRQHPIMPDAQARSPVRQRDNRHRRQFPA